MVSPLTGGPSAPATTPAAPTLTVPAAPAPAATGLRPYTFTSCVAAPAAPDPTEAAALARGRDTTAEAALSISAPILAALDMPPPGIPITAWWALLGGTSERREAGSGGAGAEVTRDVTVDTEAEAGTTDAAGVGVMTGTEPLVGAGVT